MGELTELLWYDYYVIYIQMSHVEVVNDDVTTKELQLYWQQQHQPHKTIDNTTTTIQFTVFILNDEYFLGIQVTLTMQLPVRV